MTFFVRKSLALGPIRFGVAPRREQSDIDQDLALSTGAAGEFLRKRRKDFYFADNRNVGAPVLPTTKGIGSTSFRKSLIDGTPRGWGFLALMILGVIFFLLGVAVVVNKGAQGWVEIILGIAMIATPIVLTAQTRRAIREREEKERAEREERERRHRAMLASYIAALDELRKNPTDQTLANVAREREALELPYEIWSAPARETVLRIALATLAKVNGDIAQVARTIDNAGRATGLTDEDIAGVKQDLYATIAWHLLADDRVGEAQSAQLRNFRKELDVHDTVEEKAETQFAQLRGVTRETLPHEDCSIRLGFRESCIHATRGTLVERVKTKGRDHLVNFGTGSLYITNKRLILDGRKQIDVPLMKIDDVEVDVDENLLVIGTARPLKPILIRVDDPIYTAALIDLATTIDDRPRSFA